MGSGTRTSDPAQCHTRHQLAHYTTPPSTPFSALLLLLLRQLDWVSGIQDLRQGKNKSYASTRRHISCIFGLCLPVRVTSSAVMCLMVLDLASLLERAPVLPYVLWLRASHPSRGGLRCCHMPRGFRPVSLLEGAPTLPRVLWLRTLPLPP
jgi:hypothetical protein